MMGRMAFHIGLQCPPGVRFISTRSAATYKPFALKSKAILSYRHTPLMKKASGFLSSRLNFFSDMNRQCPVPPIVRPKVVETGKNELQCVQISNEHTPTRNGQDIPFAAVMVYRLLMLGVKLGVASYCVKWTRDQGMWGSSRESIELRIRWSAGLHNAFPELEVSAEGSEDSVSSLGQLWNAAVIRTFDSMVDATRWLINKAAVESERQVFGLPPNSPTGDCEREEEKAKGVEDPNVILPDSSESYGTKASSGLMESEEVVVVVEGEVIESSESKNVPEL